MDTYIESGALGPLDLLMDAIGSHGDGRIRLRSNHQTSWCGSPRGKHSVRTAPSHFILNGLDDRWQITSMMLRATRPALGLQFGAPRVSCVVPDMRVSPTHHHCTIHAHPTSARRCSCIVILISPTLDAVAADVHMACDSTEFPPSLSHPSHTTHASCPLQWRLASRQNFLEVG